MSKIGVVFVMEIGLGHTTFYKNMQDAISRTPDINATWIPITFEKSGLLSRIPKLRNDIVLRAGIQARRKLKSVLKTSACDVLFFHTQMPAVFCHTFMQRIPTLVSIDCTPRQFTEMGRYYGINTNPNTASERRHARWYRRLFQASRLVGATSAWAAQGAMQDYGLEPGRVAVHRFFVDLDMYQPRLRGVRNPRDPLRLLFVGGDLKRKGGDLLLRWMRECAPPNCTLDIVTRETVPETKRVTVYSDINSNDPRLIKLFHDADLFVLPTRADASPLVLIEAMASGCPILATSIAAIPEMVTVGADPAGLLVRPDSWDSFAEGMNHLCNEPDLLAKFASAARQRAETFDRTENMTARLDALRQLAGNSKR